MTNTKDRHLRLVRSTDVPVEDRVRLLQPLDGPRRLKAIIDDPDPVSLVARMHPLDLYRTAVEVGLTDAGELAELAEGEQVLFCLDMELWDGSSFREEKSVEWLNFLVDAGEDVVRGLLPHLDPELLMLILKRQIIVGGGIGELAGEEERLEDWDHTFDSMFMIKFRNPKTARVVGSLLDMVFRLDHPLYVSLMEGVKTELEAELEELAYRFRCGRLADAGFPEPEQAVEVYAPIDPASFIPGEMKEKPGESGRLMLAPADDNPRLADALAAGGEETEVELTCLINSVVVADRTDLSDPENLRKVMGRVYAYLGIAVEYVAEASGASWQQVVGGNSLRDLFRLGLGILRSLRKLEPPPGEGGALVMQGLRQQIPLYWEGIDSSFDRFREFRDLDDVRRVEKFLSSVGKP